MLSLLCCQYVVFDFVKFVLDAPLFTVSEPDLVPVGLSFGSRQPISIVVAASRSAPNDITAGLRSTDENVEWGNPA